MSGCLSDDTLVAMMEQRVSPERLAEIRRHLETCADCRQLVAAADRASPSQAPFAATGSQASPPPPVAGVLPAGANVGRYIVIGRIGSGGMGVVYAAFDPELDRKVALKLVSPVPARGEVHEDPRALLLNEARAMARLSHPNVLPVHDAGPFDGRIFIAMEYAEGGTLSRWLRERPRGFREVLRKLLPAGSGLSAAHAAGLIHGDFKPDNVLLGKDGRVRVTDFGLARFVEIPAEMDRGQPRPPGSEVLALTRTGAFAGTPAYMAPEQLRGQPSDARSDLFSYCVTLYEALYRRHPFHGETLSALRTSVLAGRVEEPPPGSRVPRWLRRRVLRGLQPRPEDRPGSMEDLLGDLSRDPRRLRTGAAIGVAIAALAAVVVVQAARSRGATAARCSGAAAKLSGIWDASRRARVARAFRATGRPFAPDTWRRVRKTLGRYAHGWVKMHEDACAATRIRGEQSEAMLDLRTECLEERRRALRGLTDLFARADAKVVAGAIRSAETLPAVAACADRAWLKTALRPPRDPARRARAASIRGRLASVRALEAAGRYREARRAAEAEVSEARALGWEPVVAEALLVAGRVQSRLGAHKVARRNLRQAYLSGLGARHARLSARALIALTEFFGSRLAQAARGRDWGEQARAAIRGLGSAPLLLLALERALGRTALTQNDHRRALEHLHRALAIAQKHAGPDHLRNAAIVGDIAVALRLRGDDEGAAKLLRRTLAITRRRLGPEHPTVADRLARLGFHYGSRYLFDTAIPYYEQSLAIYRRSFGPDHPSTWRTETAMGAHLTYAGRYRQARRALERATRAAVKLYGANDPRIAMPLDNLAMLSLYEGRYEEALKHFHRSRKIARERLGPRNVALSYSDVGIGMIRLAQGRTTEALARFQSALDLRRKGFSATHPGVATVLNHLGDLRMRQGKLAMAMKHYRDALALREKKLGPRAPDTAESLTGVAEVHLARGRPAQAAPFARRAVAIYERSPGDPPAVARARFVMARGESATRGDPSVALRLARQALAAYLRIPHYSSEAKRVRRWLARRQANGARTSAAPRQEP